MPVKQIATPSKRRGWRNAAREVGFFFMMLVSLSFSRKSGVKFPKIFKATELFNRGSTARLRATEELTTNEHQWTPMKGVEISVYSCALVVRNLLRILAH